MYYTEFKLVTEEKKSTMSLRKQYVSLAVGGKHRLGLVSAGFVAAKVCQPLLVWNDTLKS